MEETDHSRDGLLTPDAGTRGSPDVGAASSPTLPRRLIFAGARGRGLPFLVGRRLMRSRLAIGGDAARWMSGGNGAVFRGCSRSVMALDLVWNLAFVLASASALLASAAERPASPLRVWVFGYAMQCLFHVGFVLFEFRRRRGGSGRGVWAEDEGQDEEDNRETWEDGADCRMVNKLESINAAVSFLWWLLGFYWIVVGGQPLLQDAPRLYWLSVVFLAFDVFFAVICIIMACVISIAVCCCLPCIIAFLYAVAGYEGASDEDLRSLARFRFCQVSNRQKIGSANDQETTITLSEPDNNRSSNDFALPLDDSECCICLTHYEDGVEINTLPCNHHFHSTCIVTWLRMNATCPLCKFDIRRSNLDSHV